MGQWEGIGRRFVVGAGYALYRGPLADSTSHRHAAFQVAVAAAGDEVTIVDGAGVRHRGAAVVVAPMVWHRMAPVREVSAFFVDPHCAFADRLRAGCGDGVTVAPQWRDLVEEDLRASGVLPSAEVDVRLWAAMEALTDHRVALPGLAARVGLSPQRLRALARRQLGVPLARWRIWRRLARAADALGEGRTLAEAALAGGFADQAHFSRQMREMTGLTPSAVLPVLRASGRAGGPAGGQDPTGGAGAAYARRAT
ncbi:helix-turn-helix domain-containing protein [Kitasatospora sp. NPDC098663]|uniref:helix-turn-helix domain-containing protein n=1 Tax=Kitasatospora sp. NPDC098663 TaxID=3364096 RepID=UPI0038282B3F